MATREELEAQLTELRRKLKAERSILEMMQKGTKLEDLKRMRKEQLEPIERDIRRAEEEIQNQK